MIRENRGPGCREAHSNHNPLKSSGYIPLVGMNDKAQKEWDEVLGKLIKHYHFNAKREEVSYNLTGIEVKQPQFVLGNFKTGAPEYILFSLNPLEKIQYFKFLAKQVISCFERREFLKEFKQEYKKTLDEHIKEGVLYPGSRCSSFEEFLEKIKTDKKTKKEILNYEPLLKKYL